MNVYVLSAWILASFSGLCATLYTIFGPSTEAWVFPVGLFGLACLQLFLAATGRGGSDA